MAVVRLMVLNCCRWVCRFYHRLIQLACHVIRVLARHLVVAMAIPVPSEQTIYVKKHSKKYGYRVFGGNIYA